MPTQDPRAGADKMENTNKMTERRENLKKTSNTVKELMEAGKIKATNLNDALLESYNGKKKNQVWLTLELWQAAGYSVRKGETAQMIWGMKVIKTSESNEEYSYYPVAYVFNNTQVDRSSRNFKENPVPESRVPVMADANVTADLPF
jgi:antirestriction protein ArdC